MTDLVASITAEIGRRFRTFGGDSNPGFNPIAHAIKGKPMSFALDVEVHAVVEAVLELAGVNRGTTGAEIVEPEPMGAVTLANAEHAKTTWKRLEGGDDCVADR